MFYQRKNFDNAWFSFKLSKEDVAAVENLTINYGLKTLQKINHTAGSNNIKLTEIDRAAMLLWVANTFESFASDFIESKVAAEKKAKEAAPAAQ